MVVAAGRREAALSLDDSVTAIRGVGPVRSCQLARSGIETVGDLLAHLPSSYQDRRAEVSLAAARGMVDLQVTVAATVNSMRQLWTRRRRLSVLEGVLGGSGDDGLRAIWFQRPHLLRRLEIGTRYRFHGVIRQGRRGVQLVNPEVTDDDLAEARPTAVYGRLGDIPGSFFRRAIGECIDRLGEGAADGRTADPIPASMLRDRSLPVLTEALRSIHRPDPEADLAPFLEQRSPAHQRLIYGELLALQLALGAHRRLHDATPKPHRYVVDEAEHRRIEDSLPFALTAAQRRALQEIFADLERPASMLRLLQGDVGCGKTVVAACAMLAASRNGLQAAFMAPTELLAEQHAASLRSLFGSKHPVELLTGSSPDAGVRERLERGTARLVVGTHALFQAATSFDRLALVVVDEQHRFGVAQRRALWEKGSRPDVLLMTATPIPRSLALVLYGDFDLSMIDELPPGRLPVATEVVPERDRERVLEVLAAELASGGQAFVVFPRIGNAEVSCVVPGAGNLGAALTVAGMGAHYATRLLPVASGVITGRTERTERQRLIGQFLSGEIRLLIATTVIEVGIDLPAATVMVVESAERFGLSQLHQLRGRVGRGRGRGRCYLIHGELAEDARLRLAALEDNHDGFAIAEADLLQRGPGDLLGSRQAGAADLRHAHLVRDLGWVQAAREDARRCLERERDPAYRLLFDEVKRRSTRFEVDANEPGLARSSSAS